MDMECLEEAPRPTGAPVQGLFNKDLSNEVEVREYWTRHFIFSMINRLTNHHLAGFIQTVRISRISRCF